MMDKFLASSVVTCRRFDAEKISIDRGKLLERINGDYKRFQMTDDGISPRSYLGADDGIFWSTGDESDERGHNHRGSRNAHSHDGQANVPP